MLMILFSIFMLISLPTHADGVKMWRDADGNVHFGDYTPAGMSSESVDVTPQNETGVYGRANQIEADRRAELEEFLARNRKYRTIKTNNPAGLDYDDEVRLRQLELQRKEVMDRMRFNRPSVGDAIVYEEELKGINQQIRDIHERSREPVRRDNASLDYDDELRLRQLELQKKQVNDRMKNRRLSVAEGIVLEQEIEDINRQILDIERRR